MDIIKLRSLRGRDDSGLSRSALNGLHKCLCNKEAEGDLTHVQKGRQCEGGDRNRST